MAKSTFLQLVQASCQEFGEPAVTAVAGQTGNAAIYVRFVQEADVEIQGLWFDWDFLHVGTWSANTVIGTAAVAAPADIGVWDNQSFYLNYSLATYQQIYPIEYKAWRANYRQGVQTNKMPSNVVVMPDQSLKLYPPPDAVYSLTADYWKRPAKMTADANTSPIPEEYERIIIAKAKIAYGEKMSAMEVYQSGQVEYNLLLDKLEAKYLSNQSGRRMSDPGMMVVRVE